MKIFDISMNISEEIQVYKNIPQKKPIITITDNFITGSAHESKLEMNLHTGTHMDAPLHMIEKGKTINEFFNAENSVTRCTVLDFTELEDRITEIDLKTKSIPKGYFILLKTKNSFSENFNLNFVFLDKSGAEYLKSKEVIGVGTDSLGIERSQPGHETHKTLLENGIMILEGLRLKDIHEGEYKLFAAPLKIEGAEAAPVRALLFNE